MSFDLEALLRYEDRKQAFRTSRNNCVSEDTGKREPDWTAFEGVFARDLLPSQGGSGKTMQFFLELVDILLEYVRKNHDRSCKVLDFHHPHQLREMMDHCLDVAAEPRDLEQILSDCKETLKYCVKTGHPRFFNQLSSGLDMIALAGEWLTSAANTNMFTYEVAPVFTLMESIVLERMRDIIGWEEGDGIFSPGGAISNLYAVHAARFRKIPNAKTQGLYNLPRLVMFTSEHSHFSLKSAGSVLGIGTDNVINIKTDDRGKIIPEILEAEIQKALKEGAVPFFVNATAATTVLGAFDPISDIADICEKYNIWMHVDAAWGGGVLMTSKYRHLVTGIERADSVTWNPHKMMGATLQCSAILTKHTHILSQCNSLNADYLFQQDKNYDVQYDTGDKAIQCGRHNDIFKLWLMWRAKGDNGFESQIDRIFDMRKYMLDKLKEREGFEILLENPECTNVCFWYVPQNMRAMPPGHERDVKLAVVAPKIKGLMMESGSTLVGYQPLGDKPNFFRSVISNPACTKADVDFLLDEICRLGEEI